jgi:predicted transcriptional regulator
MNEEKHKKNKHILSRAILEIVGAPQEHIEKSLKDFVEHLKNNENYDIINTEFAETKPHDKLFSTFVEIDIWVPNMNELFGFCIDAMPSSIEILEPDELVIPARDVTNSLNELQQKLHNVDLRLKQLQSQKNLLEQNTATLAANLVGFILKDKPLAVEEISKESGIPLEKIKTFLESLVKEGRIVADSGMYSLKK